MNIKVKPGFFKPPFQTLTMTEYITAVYAHVVFPLFTFKQ